MLNADFQFDEKILKSKKKNVFSHHNHQKMELLHILLIAGKPTGDFQGSFQVFSSFFIGISLILIAIGVILKTQQNYWFSHSHVTTGKIVELSKRYSRDDHFGKFPTYFPIVSYLVNGSEFKKESEVGVKSEEVLGKEVPVRYLSENPNDSTLNVDNSPVMSSYLFFVLGGLLLISSLGMIFIINK